MINQKQTNIDIADGLSKALNCPVIKSNVATERPIYPFISFTITTPLRANGGTWEEYEGYKARKVISQTWSFTALSNDDNEALELAIKAYEWFSRVGAIHLNDRGIIVQKVYDVKNRDLFLTVGYEYRYGFDVNFTLSLELTDNIERIESVERKRFGIESVNRF